LHPDSVRRLNACVEFGNNGMDILIVYLCCVVLCAIAITTR
jgi:hypothetical protein